MIRLQAKQKKISIIDMKLLKLKKVQLKSNIVLNIQRKY